MLGFGRLMTAVGVEEQTGLARTGNEEGKWLVWVAGWYCVLIDYACFVTYEEDIRSPPDAHHPIR